MSGPQNDIKNLGVIRYHPEIEDVIRPVGVAPLDLPADDQITHAVADMVLSVNDEHYSVLYLGTGVCMKLLLQPSSIHHLNHIQSPSCHWGEGRPQANSVSGQRPADLQTCRDTEGFYSQQLNRLHVFAAPWGNKGPISQRPLQSKNSL